MRTPRCFVATSASKGFTVSLAPVLPLCAFSRDKLRGAGIPFELLSGYVVLTKQRVLGISFQFIKDRIEADLEDQTSDFAKELKRTKSEDSVSARFKEKINEYYEHAVNTYKARNSQMEVVGQPNAWNHARWYWMVPKGELRLMRSCVFNDKALLNRWGFAFNSADLNKLKGQAPRPAPVYDIDAPTRVGGWGG